MKYYFLIVGVLSVLYYLLLAWLFTAADAQRLRDSGWITGGVHLALGCAPFSDSVFRILKCAVIAVWILFAAVEILIVFRMVPQRGKRADQIIVLGAQVRGRRITNSLKRRLDAALSYLEAYPETRVIVSGGRGKGEDISEAEAIGGIPDCQEVWIRAGYSVRNRSTSTKENFRLQQKVFGCRKFSDRNRD